MRKNYYLILGVASDSNQEEIKAAFRRRAMELHPDLSGLGSGPFIEVQEAYGVLSDPARRRDYDRHWSETFRSRPWSASVESFGPRRRYAEPFSAAGVREASFVEPFRPDPTPFREGARRRRPGL